MKQVSLIVHPLVLYTYGYVVRRLVIIIIIIIINGALEINRWGRFNTITADHQPIVAYLKLGRTLHRLLLVSIPDPFSSRPNIKEEKAVWLARLPSTL